MIERIRVRSKPSQMRFSVRMNPQRHSIFLPILVLASVFTTDASVFERGRDPEVSAIVTSFLDHDLQDPTNAYDILTGWKKAVDELSSLGVNEITFAVFRNVKNGSLVGGTATQTVATAVKYAIDKGLSVTILPIFETESGWRGNYDPAGEERSRFRADYEQWIKELSSIAGIDRFNIGSELSRMVKNPENMPFFVNLIRVVKRSFSAAGNRSGRIGYAANFDAYSSEQHRRLFTQPGVDFLGVSAYRRLVEPADASLVSSTDQVPDRVFDRLVTKWNRELNQISQFARSVNLPVVIQEFGATQKNYAAVAPSSTSPGDFVATSQPNRFVADPLEQRACFESLITALDGRGNEIESVVFWTWEHQASRGRRTHEALKQNDDQTKGDTEHFAIWPSDGGGGQFLAEFLATGRRPGSSLRIVNPFFNSDDESD